MAAADIVGVAIIVVFISLGLFHGFVRGAAAFAGVFLGIQVAEKMRMNGATSGAFVGTFAGIFIGCLVAGYLIYGATKVHPIESFESIFGVFFGLLVGWGIAKFVFSYYLYYMPGSAFAMQIAPGSALAWDIYTVAPYQWFMAITEGLRHPRI